MAGADPVGLWLASRLRRRHRAGPPASVRGSRARRQIRLAGSKAARDQTDCIRGDACALHGRGPAHRIGRLREPAESSGANRLDGRVAAVRARSMQWRRLQVALAGLLAALMVPTQPARAHEVRPAYLQIDEVGPGRYQLHWRTPMLAGMRLPVVLRLPDEIHNIVEP